MDEYYSDDSNFPKFGEGSYYELNYAISVYKPDGSVIHYHMKDLLKYFEVIVGSEMDGRRDKKADVIREVFRRAGISEEEKASVLMIGDRRHDMIGAAQTGIDSLGIYSGYAEPGELEKAGGTYVVHSVQEMRELLRSLTARHS